MKIERVWAMPNHRTFQIKPIKKFITQNLTDVIIDPFQYPFKEDALELLKKIKSESVESITFDPPYSPRQLKEMYDSAGLDYQTNSSYWSRLKDEIQRIVRPGGKVISFGWNSNGIGKKRGFEILKILLVAHGGSHNDTVCTLEIKRQERLF